MKVLVTGGAGYLGSITAAALEQAGHTPVILDSLVSGPRRFTAGRIFYEGDVADRALLRRIVAEHPDLDCTVHMAARIVVPESVREPYLYYRDNVARSLELFDELARLGHPRVIFSSSASVYAVPAGGFEVHEGSALAPQSPYARTKLVIEMTLRDLAAAGRVRALLLRYFNPVGADPALRYGPYVRTPSHVLGQLLSTAKGERPYFALTGTRHPTRDGSGIRDYLHVWDLARAHVAAVERFDSALEAVASPSVAINLGTGSGVTVRELVAAFERVLGAAVPVEEAPPRPGDSAGAFANVDRSRELLGWRSRLGLDEAIASALAWDRVRESVLADVPPAAATAGVGRRPVDRAQWTAGLARS